MQWPDTQNVLYEYAPDQKSGNPRQLLYEQRIWSPYVQEGFENGNAFYGTKGMMLLGKSGGYKIYAERNKLVEEETEGRPDLEAHHRNCLDAIRDKAKPNANALEAHLSSSLCHLANIAMHSGGLIRLESGSESIVDNDDANKLLGRRYRRHWATPKNA